MFLRVQVLPISYFGRALRVVRRSFNVPVGRGIGYSSSHDSVLFVRMFFRRVSEAQNSYFSGGVAAIEVGQVVGVVEGKDTIF